MFVCSTIEIVDTKQKTNEDYNSRNGTRFFNFLCINGNKVPICQSMYFRTWGLNKSEVRYCIQNFKNTNILAVKYDESILGNKNNYEHDNRDNEPQVNKNCQKIAL